MKKILIYFFNVCGKFMGVCCIIFMAFIIFILLIVLISMIFPYVEKAYTTIKDHENILVVNLAACPYDKIEFKWFRDDFGAYRYTTSLLPRELENMLLLQKNYEKEVNEFITLYFDDIKDAKQRTINSYNAQIENYQKAIKLLEDETLP